MDDNLVDRILNMYQSPEPFSIVMPAPSNRRQVKENSSILDKELHSCHVETMESEIEYVKQYVQKDEEEYIEVIIIKICNDIAVLFILFILFISFLLFLAVKK